MAAKKEVKKTAVNKKTGKKDKPATQSPKRDEKGRFIKADSPKKDIKPQEESKKDTPVKCRKEQVKRDSCGRFQKGSSGNPAGRPVGTYSDLARMARQSAFLVWPLIEEKALQGDKSCMELVATYSMPKIKTAIEINDGPPTKLQEIIQAYEDGKMSLKEAVLAMDKNSIPIPDGMKIL